MLFLQIIVGAALLVTALSAAYWVTVFIRVNAMRSERMKPYLRRRIHSMRILSAALVPSFLGFVVLESWLLNDMAYLMQPNIQARIVLMASVEILLAGALFYYDLILRQGVAQDAELYRKIEDASLEAQTRLATSVSANSQAVTLMAEKLGKLTAKLGKG